jgi:N-acylneuraminate cytidylyltransferase
MNIISIIPARGGSKGLPRKNVLPFNGKPLIVHSINYALDCKLINTVYVSTDDKEISEISMEHGAKVIHRPDHLSGDEATTESAIEHTLSEISETPDIIVLLQATSPLRPNNSLNGALEKFINNNYDSMLSISPTHRFFWSINNENSAIPQYDFLNRPRRQDMKKSDIKFVENGSVYIFTHKHFQSVKNRLGGKIGYMEFDEKFSYEIDSITDFKFLELLAKNE